MIPKEKAEVLIEALPYIKKYHNKRVVIKFGGSAMVKMKYLIEDIVLLKRMGMRPIIVHGGGSEIDVELKNMKITTKFIDGLRFTDDKIIKIIEKIFSGTNNEIVANIINHKAKSITAKGYIKVKQKNSKLGLVGEIIEINKEGLLKLVNSGYVPVISPLGIGNDGKIYNINADTVASSLAVSLKTEKLTILTDVDGVLINGKLVSHLNINLAKKEIKKGTINKGMIPKIEACIYAVNNNCQKAHLINGLIPHSILLEIFTDQGIGTEIVY